MGLSNLIRVSCFAERFALMVSRTLSRNAFTFLADGLINSLPSYLRTFLPEKVEAFRDARDCGLFL